MIVFKTGVSHKGLRPEMWEAMYICAPIFAAHALDLVVTSSREGKHTVRRSKHYSGDATDWRSKHLPANARAVVLQQIKNKLGDDYVVILEAPEEVWEHYHVHFAPVYNPTLRYA